MFNKIANYLDFFKLTGGLDNVEYGTLNIYIFNIPSDAKIQSINALTSKFICVLGFILFLNQVFKIIEYEICKLIIEIFISFNSKYKNIKLKLELIEQL